MNGLFVLLAILLHNAKVSADQQVSWSPYVGVGVAPNLLLLQTASDFWGIRGYTIYEFLTIGEQIEIGIHKSKLDLYTSLSYNSIDDWWSSFGSGFQDSTGRLWSFRYLQGWRDYRFNFGFRVYPGRAEHDYLNFFFGGSLGFGRGSYEEDHKRYHENDSGTFQDASDHRTYYTDVFVSEAVDIGVRYNLASHWNALLLCHIDHTSVKLDNKRYSTQLDDRIRVYTPSLVLKLHYTFGKLS